MPSRKSKSVAVKANEVAQTLVRRLTEEVPVELERLRESLREETQAKESAQQELIDLKSKLSGADAELNQKREAEKQLAKKIADLEQVKSNLEKDRIRLLAQLNAEQNTKQDLEAKNGILQSSLDHAHSEVSAQAETIRRLEKDLVKAKAESIFAIHSRIKSRLTRWIK